MSYLSDLQAIMQFWFDCMGSIYTLVMGSILVFGVILWVIALVIKLFKRIL